VLRAAAIIVREGAVLLQRRRGDPFWALPGGRIELGEAATDALKREMQEEIALDGKVERLPWTIENFFDHADAHHHELGLYFDVRLPLDAAVESREPGLQFAWFPLDRLAAVDLRPAFLIEALTRNDADLVHHVQRDAAAGRR
jgi:8-oxo-dGTP pyrophosphatase MutT (NUDIX family)